MRVAAVLMDILRRSGVRYLLARALGVRAERVDKPDVLGDVLRACLAHPGPALVDVAIDRSFRAM